MKFEATAGTLASALSAATLALEKRKIIEALSMVRVTATDDGRVIFTVDSIDRCIAIGVAVTVIESGEASARCASLVKLLSGLKSDQAVRLARSDDNITISAGRSRFKISGLPIENLPAAAVLTDAKAELEFASEDLLHLIRATEHAISTEETRYYLGGIYLHPADGTTLVGVATDGYRLAHYKQVLNGGIKDVPAVIIPGATVDIIHRLLERKDAPEYVTLRISARLFEMVLPDLRLISKLIDATYPDYARLIPEDYSATADVDRVEFEAALARVEATMNPDFKRLAYIAGLTWGNGALHVERIDEGADTDDVLEAETNGTGRTAAKISYLRDALAALGGKRVHIACNGDRTPIRIINPDDPAVFTIVMPTKR